MDLGFTCVLNVARRLWKVQSWNDISWSTLGRSLSRYIFMFWVKNRELKFGCTECKVGCTHYNFYKGCAGSSEQEAIILNVCTYWNVLLNLLFSAGTVICAFIPSSRLKYSFINLQESPLELIRGIEFQWFWWPRPSIPNHLELVWKF
jgi:hypothetical protein